MNRTFILNDLDGKDSRVHVDEKVKYKFILARLKLNKAAQPQTQMLNPLLDQDLTIDQCVAKNHEDCRRVKWKYNQFLCGNAPVCTGHSEAEKKKASEIAKLNIAKNFYLVGILEQFIDTLHLFEKVMPKYYDR